MAKPSTAELFMPAAREALAAFGVTPGEVTLAAYSENLTFRVTDGADGAVYALRLHRPGYNSLDELRAEHAWSQALSAAGVCVPTAVLARDGRSHVEACVPGLGQQRFASMTRWVQGRLLSSVLEEVGDPAVVETYLMALGSVVARMHEQASGWRPPPGFTRRRLDLDALIGERPLFGRFDEHPSLSDDERRLLLLTRERIVEALGGRAPTASTFSLIHADIHPENIIVSGDRLCLLDFDDAAYGWLAYDLAVGLFYLHGKANCAGAQQALVEGYRTVRGLDDDTVAQIPFFRLARALMMIGWFQQRPKLAGTQAFAQIKQRVLAQCLAG